MPKTREDFELESGLFDDLDVTFSPDTYFGPPPGDYAAFSNEVGLHLVMESPELEKPLDQFYSCGKGWVVTDNGKGIANEAKPDKHVFIKGSSAGILVEAMIAKAGGDDYEKGAVLFANRDQYMTQSAFYAGLMYHMLRQEVKRTFDKEVKISKILVPTKFLGEAKGAAGKKAAAGATPSSDNAVLDKIVTDLAEGKTERELKGAALKVDALKANSAYMKDLISGAVLKRLEADGKLSKGPDGKYV